MTSVTVSATECAASESIALEPLIRPATSFAAAMPRLAAAATATVNLDSPPVLFSSLMVGSMSAYGASVPGDADHTFLDDRDGQLSVRRVDPGLAETAPARRRG